VLSIEAGCSIEGTLEWKQGPLLPVEVARDLWLALHKTRNAGASERGLEKNEEHLYQCLTERFCCEATILSLNPGNTKNEGTNDNEDSHRI
jgi:hypothetical protein